MAIDLDKLKDGKKIEVNNVTVDFERMTSSERRRLNFKKAATKQINPHQMQAFKDQARAIASMTFNLDEETTQ